jgi:hypothetical protein
MRRRPCHCHAGVVALVTTALLPLIHDSIVALVAMALLPSSSWHPCPHCNGVIVIIDVFALVACCQAGIIVIEQWQWLLLSQLSCCHR